MSCRSTLKILRGQIDNEKLSSGTKEWLNRSMSSATLPSLRLQHGRARRTRFRVKPTQLRLCVKHGRTSSGATATARTEANSRMRGKGREEIPAWWRQSTFWITTSYVLLAIDISMYSALYLSHKLLIWFSFTFNNRVEKIYIFMLLRRYWMFFLYLLCNVFLTFVA